MEAARAIGAGNLRIIWHRILPNSILRPAIELVTGIHLGPARSPLAPATEEEHTAGWLAVAKNPLVDVIGHAGDERYRFDVDAVVKAFAENGKIVEINAHSFECRPGSAENCRRIAESCKKYGVRVVCSSDAHFFTQIGNVGAAVEMLEEIGFPEELVMNADYGRFLALAREKSGRPLI